MNTDSSKQNKLSLILIFVLFCGPLVGAWWLHSQNTIVEARGKTNHGQLILPPRPVSNLALIDPLSVDSNKKQLHGKWSLFVIAEGACDDECVANLYRMRQLRQAMGKHTARLQRVVLFTQPEQNDFNSLLENYPGQMRVDIENLDLQSLISKFSLPEYAKPAISGRLYIVDPLGNLMMSYAFDANPIGIIKDLNKLLRASKIG
ncbi:MAG: SCO family protein [Proteobacteria bacterium]|nr:SCO family protein [Pseudomonadota bacterium]